MKKLATILMILVLVLSQIGTAQASESVFLKLESVDLSEDFQKYVFEVAGEYHISPYIILAMIERESTNNPSSIGDNGKSYGLMQIMKKYHLERMDRLGVTDLLDPYQSILTGIDYLYELLQIDCDIYWALMCYNGGFTHANDNNINPTSYANFVVERSMELEKEMHRNEIKFKKTLFLESRLNKGVVKGYEI